jgi:hypothetical protein
MQDNEDLVNKDATNKSKKRVLLDKLPIVTEELQILEIISNALVVPELDW